jgi:hypothetical protein
VSEVPDNEKPAAGSSPAAHPPAGSGEGADTAFQAMIRKRRMRTDDEPPPPLSADALPPDSPRAE